jgi:hypothetical protein
MGREEKQMEKAQKGQVVGERAEAYFKQGFN